MNHSQKELFASYLDLFDKKAFANISTLMKDGSPQVTPVWVDYDGEYILINSSEGRQKVKNIQRDPRIALSIQDPDNPYRKLIVRGRVVERTVQGAEAHIDKLAKKYTGAEQYKNRAPGMVRVILKIRPEHASG
jgi:PPOX class probable F420-dependent enzyme